MKENTFGVAELGSDGPGDADAKLIRPTATAHSPNPHPHPNAIFIKLGPDLLPAGGDVKSLMIEVSDLDANPSSVGADNFLSVRYKNNLVLRNLTLTGFANHGHRSEGVLSVDVDKYNGHQVACDRVLLQNVTIRDNANRGANFASIRNLTVDHCRFLRNGQNGSSGGRLQDGYVVDSVWDGNNWRSDGFGSAYGWASANFKLVITQRLNFQRCDFLNGHSNGLWFDLYNSENTVEDVRTINNAAIGIFQEISPGPALFKNCNASLNKLGLLIAHGRITSGNNLPGNEVHTWTKTVRADAVRWVKVPEEQTAADLTQR